MREAPLQAKSALGKTRKILLKPKFDGNIFGKKWNRLCVHDSVVVSKVLSDLPSHPPREK